MPASTIGIVGAGTMGRGIAQVAATSGFTVILIDVTQAAVEEARAAVVRNLDRLVAKGKMSVAERDLTVGRLSVSLEYDSLRQAQLVIEAASEGYEVKRK